MIKVPLENSQWTVQATGKAPDVPNAVGSRPIPAAVPGCVHTDLLAAGLIEDPYLGTNEATLQWIGLTDWQYRCSFEADPTLFEQERIDLACDGLDTVATIHLNGQEIGRSENMHVGYRFEARSAIRRGTNELTITFASAVKYARHWEEKLGKLPWMNTPEPFNFIRKMACNFGWDWGPALVTAGIWRAIRLEGWSGCRIAGVRPLVLSSAADHAAVRVLVDLERSAAARDQALELQFELTDPNGSLETQFYAVQSGETSIETILDVDSPQLWWPIGHGAQPLYNLHVLLAEGSAAPRGGEMWSGRIGLRCVELDSDLDDVGRKFVIKINGKPIFCKGFNWIPDDCFLNRACMADRYQTRLTQALDANANMLRVWGGGIFETDAFYDLCDEMGILVWQDFLFACAAYPEEEPFHSLVEQEARYNVARLSRHPSLVLWNGCNENVWGYHDWGWKQGKLPAGRTWGPGYYFKLLPAIVKEVDPSRPYWAASPWSGDPDVENGLHPNLASHGNKHVWEAWFNEAYTAYRRFIPRFCSEFGFQGPPTFATLERAIPKEQLFFGSDAYKAHQKSPSGDDNNDRHLREFFQTPDNFDDRHYLLQLNQARALQLGVEWFRSRAPQCMGTLYWQLNDCWPSISWSAIDGDGRFKPLYYATRRFFAPRLLAIQPLQDYYELCVVNDSDEAWNETIEVFLHDLRTGASTPCASVRVAVGPRGVGRHPLGQANILRPWDQRQQVLIAQGKQQRATWFYLPDKDLRYPVPEINATLTQHDGGVRLKLTAKTFIRDLAIFIDRLDPQATISDQLTTLLAGESVELTIKTDRPIKSEDLASRPIMQCANFFGAGD